MTAYIVRRLLLAIPVMVLVATATFLLLHMTPGDPVAVLLGPDATTEQIAELRRELGLNDPLYVQYGRWVAGALRGDLGKASSSISQSRQPLSSAWHRRPSSVFSPRS
ncbi:hypothetical protein [Thermomicrobium sp.]